MINTYLFVLSPPKTGSTLLWKILGTSPNVSSLPDEGQHLEPVADVLQEDRWNEYKKMPWEEIKEAWEEYWDLEQPILLEKSPPEIIRAEAIDRVFEPTRYVALIRNPYAWCQSMLTRGEKWYTPTRAAHTWVRRAEFQRKNIHTLEDLYWTTYEELVEETERVLEEIVDFFPELERLDASAPSTRSLLGPENKIRNLNPIKIQQLGWREIRDINEILEENREILDFFGYETLHPRWTRPLKSALGKARRLTLRAVRFREILPDPVIERTERFILRDE